ncbi:hypothetical protein [Amycolatopsis kentuckyensis]|uniref:hypothetical protein n=1 Tax=Amycolatopsis kentuckyensis TaxID=218823 RepID=UPI00356A38D2
MNGRRALAELLSELAESAAAFAGVAGEMPVRPRSLWLSLPVDLRLIVTAGEPEVVADVPLFRTRTDFDPDPARLEVEWRAVPRPADEVRHEP